MKTATLLLHLDTDEEGSNGSDFAEDNQSIKLDNLDLDTLDYDSDAPGGFIRRVWRTLH